jgi:hypothetical protein
VIPPAEPNRPTHWTLHAAAVVTLLGVCCTGVVVDGELPAWALLVPLVLFVTLPLGLISGENREHWRSRLALVASPVLALGASQAWVTLNTRAFVERAGASSTAAWRCTANEATWVPEDLRSESLVVYRWIPGCGGRLGVLRDGEVDRIVDVEDTGHGLVVAHVDPVRFMSSGSSMVWPNR